MLDIISIQKKIKKYVNDNETKIFEYAKDKERFQYEIGKYTGWKFIPDQKQIRIVFDAQYNTTYVIDIPLSLIFTSREDILEFERFRKIDSKINKKGCKKYNKYFGFFLADNDGLVIGYNFLTNNKVEIIFHHPEDDGDYPIGFPFIQIQMNLKKKSITN